MDNLLRAAMIRLELGREDEALDLFDEIRKLNQSSLEKADYSSAVDIFLGLTADRDVAKAYWKHTASWWPEWQDICRDLPGGKKVAEAPFVGLIDDHDLYAQNMDEGRKDGGNPLLAKAYRHPAHLARWMPDLLPELGRFTIFGTGQVLRNEGERLRKFLAKAYGDSSPVQQDELGQFLLYQLLAYGDEFPEKANVIASRYFEEFPEANFSHDQAVARVWAYTAIQAKDQKQMEKASTVIEAQLGTTAPFEDRRRSVDSLADLLRKQGNFEGEKVLLERELQNPAIRGNETFSQQIRNGYKTSSNQRNREPSLPWQCANGLTVIQWNGWRCANHLRWMTAESAILTGSSPKELDDSTTSSISKAGC